MAVVCGRRQRSIRVPPFSSRWESSFNTGNESNISHRKFRMKKSLHHSVERAVVMAASAFGVWLGALPIASAEEPARQNFNQSTNREPEEAAPSAGRTTVAADMD